MGENNSRKRGLVFKKENGSLTLLEHHQDSIKMGSLSDKECVYDMLLSTMAVVVDIIKIPNSSVLLKDIKKLCFFNTGKDIPLSIEKTILEICEDNPLHLYELLYNY